VSLVSIPLPAHLTNTCVSCEAPAYRVIQPDTPIWKTLPIPPPTVSQHWQSGTYKVQTFSAPTPTQRDSTLILNDASYPVYRAGTLYINVGTHSSSYGYGDGFGVGIVPVIVERLQITLPRDATVYTVDVPLNRYYGSDTAIPLSRPYQPQVGDAITFHFVSISPNSYGVEYADGITIGDFTGVFPNNLFGSFY
jgi:hypothetical protein